MKIHRLASLCTFFAATLLYLANAPGAVYNGNGMATGGGAVAYGSLSLTDNGSTVFGTFNKGPSSFQLNLIIYIDSVSGGFTDTTHFSDSTDDLTKAVSGFAPPSARAAAYFASGFTADYAIALGVNGPNRGSLYHLVAGGDGSMEFIKSVNLNPNNNLNFSTYTFSFNWTDIGLPKGPSNFFKFQSTYDGIAGGAYRELESFESLTGTRGYNTVTFGNYSTYGVDPVPEMTPGALAIFGGIFVGARLVMRGRGKKKAECGMQNTGQRGEDRAS
jgi:hypothetical protein